MPLTHARTFRVRHYECDAHGHVNQATYLRYMQEVAFDASAAAGYDVARYQAMDRTWLIRETKIEYVRSLRYGDAVEVMTWVADFRRVRSRRAYEFRLIRTGALVAQAVTDWAFLDRVTGRPAPIPAAMKASFFPEGAPQEAPPRDRFPPAPPPPSQAHRQRRRVEWRDLDQAGHINNAVYLAYVEECGIQMLAFCGWPLARMEAEGFGVLARTHRIGYRLPGLLGDELEVETWISDVDAEGSSAVRHSTVTRMADGVVLARTRTVHVCIDPQTGRPTPIPEAFLADMAPNIVVGKPPRPS
jgi:acyl-CoA thioester hydrolase